MKVLGFIFILFLPFLSKGQGAYAPPAGLLGTTAMHKDSSAFISWANQAKIYRGYIDIRQKDLGNTSAGSEASVLGKAQVNGVVSLGDSGYVDLQFDGKIFDAPGPDFAVFENAFDAYFLELAFVEVSSDGQNFYRFPAVSLTDTNQQVGSFDSLSAENLYNLAGKYESGYGVPFDLNELDGIAGLNIQAISHIRIVDVVGSMNESYGSRDALGNKVNDPFPTPFFTGGFDLDAIGVIHIQPSSIDENQLPNLTVFPNPASEQIQFKNIMLPANLGIYQADGRLVYQQKLTRQTMDVRFLKPGFYWFLIESESKVKSIKVLIQ